MSAHHARLFLAGILGALLAGFLLGYLVRPAPAPDVPVETARAPDAVDGPTLKGQAPEARAAGAAEPSSEGAIADEEEIVEVPFEDPWSSLGAVKDPWDASPQRDPEQDRGVRGALARATLHALAGEIDACIAALVEAQASGALPHEILDVCSLLKGADWIAAVERVRAEGTPAAWDEPVLLADRAVAADAAAWGWAVLEEAFRRLTSPGEDLAYALVRIDAPRGAALLLERLRADPENLGVELATGLARTLHDSTEAVSASAFLQALLAAWPFEDEPLRLLQEIDPDAAILHAEFRLRERPEDLTALRTLATLYAARGNRAAAADMFRRIAEISPDSSSLKQVIAVDPQLGLTLAREASEGSTDDEVIGSFGLALLANGLVGEAFDAYVRAQGIDPNDAEWLRSLIEIDPRRALEALGPGARAEDAGDELIGAYGNALLESGDRAAAFEQYRRALLADADDAEWQFGLARADPERAIAVLQALVDENPECWYRSAALGAAMVEQGQRAAGLERLEAAVQNSPDYRTLHELALSDEARGVKALEGLMQRDPTNDEWYGIMGEVAARRGDRAAALAWYRKAQELDPSDVYWPRRIAILESRR